MGKIKNRQHYVFQEYLKNWINSDGKICVCNIKEKRSFSTTTNNILQKRKMYKLQSLNSDEKQFFEWVMTSLNLNDCDKQEMRNHIDMYLLPFRNEECLNTLKKIISNDSLVSNSPYFSDCLQQLEAQILEQKINTEEDFYSDYEGDGANWIKSILQGDTSFYNSADTCTSNPNKILLPSDLQKGEFLNFVCIQYFRTSGMRNQIKNNIQEMLKLCSTQKTLPFDVKNVTPEHILPHLIWILQAKCSAALSAQNAKLQVIHNNTSTPFITSDQPVINIKATNKTEAPTEFVLYYPLSPYVAIQINDLDTSKDKTITDKSEIAEYNHQMLNHSYEYIVGNSEKLLNDFVDYYL